MTDTAEILHVKAHVNLLKRKQEIEAELLGIKESIKQSVPGVLSFFEKKGVENIKVDGVTLFTKREIWAKYNEGFDTNTAAEYLAKNGYEDFAKPKTNLQGLNALLRECDKEGREIPAAIGHVVKSSEIFKVGHRS